MQVYIPASTPCPTCCFLVRPLILGILFATILPCKGIELGIYTQLNTSRC